MVMRADGGGPTWRHLVGLEPRLADLERACVMATARGGPGFCANEFWYGYGPTHDPSHTPPKRRLESLVGWHRADPGDPVLRTSEAYMAALNHLYDLLPGCSGCLCWNPELDG